MRKRREMGTFRESQNDFMDCFLLKVEEEKDKKDTMYTGIRRKLTISKANKLIS